MPLDKYPAWAEPDNVNLLENAVDAVLADYADGVEAGLSLEEFNAVATRVLPSIYAAVEAQVESAINRRANA